MVTGWFASRKKSVDPIGTYGLTPLGSQKAEAFSEPTKPNKVLGFLHENGVSTIGEISQGTQMSSEQVSSILKYLMRNRFVEKSGKER